MVVCSVFGGDLVLVREARNKEIVFNVPGHQRVWCRSIKNKGCYFVFLVVLRLIAVKPSVKIDIKAK